MNDSDQGNSPLRETTTRANAVAPAVPAVPLSEAMAPRRRQRLTVGVLLVIALIGTTATATLLSRRGPQRVRSASAVNNSPDGLAHFHWGNLPPSPIPSRFDPTIAWTGREVLIWGGATADGARLNDGAAFDPLNAKWRRIATPSGSLARSGATGIWTGQELLVLDGDGGTRAGSPAIGGAAYDPAVDQWRTLPPPAAQGAGALTAQWTGSEAVVISSTRSATAYSPSTGRWRTLSAVPEPTNRSLAQVVAVWTGSSLLAWVSWTSPQAVGGRVLGIDLFSLDVGTGQWALRTPQQKGPQGLDGAYWTGHEVVLPAASDFRGATGGPPTVGRHGYLYDPDTDNYREMAHGPVDDDAVGGVWTGAALIRTSQASASGPGLPVAVGDSAAWNPIDGEWTTLPQAPAAVARPGVVEVWAGTEVIAYGSDPLRFAP